MKNISSLQELNIPAKHQRFISEFLRLAKKISTFDKIDTFILFGSCARGNAHERSDVDILAVGDNLGDETLFDLYDCALYPGWEKDENMVDNDVFVSNRAYFDTHKNTVGSFHWRVAKDGVSLNGLLQTI
ncbi:MAG: nucleotidyltransferase domain-containing protein [Defluviitaleaceae bacterium]|nr:nucleotidyltransferase domain-containing protein [Defluviitaleaceae bacterium]MCL2239107.1 nucleotidyltransferase domain-containing protein [Defluviitaleaceae bacterium]